MTQHPINLLAHSSIRQHLQKWTFPLAITLIECEELEIDYSSTIFVDSITFIRLQLSIEKLYLVTLERENIRIQRHLNVRPLKSHNTPIVELNYELLFRSFNDTQFDNTLITEISPSELEFSTAKEVWLSPIKTAESSSHDTHDIDNQLIEYFLTPRLLYSNDVFFIECENVAQKSVFYFKVSLKESPLWVDDSTKLFQSPAHSNRYPRRKIHQDEVFIPRDIQKIAQNAHKVLDNLLRTDESSSMVVCILSGQLGFGKELCLNSIADRLCVNRLSFDCHDLWNVDGKPTKNVLSNWIEQINDLQPCICELQNLNTLNGNPSIDLESGSKIVGTLSTSLQAFKGRAALFITCLGSELATLPQTITKLAHFEYTCDDLTENDRLLFSKFIQKHYDTNFDLQWLADSIRGLMLSELNQLLNEAIVCANKNSRHQLHQSDFDWALEQRNKAFGESIGVPKIPTVTWNDVGGLDDVKQLISESLRANLNPNRSPNMRRSGIVLWGAPGCGKTLIAKAVANEFKMTFLSVKGPELLNQYIGQSEANLRQVFEKARLASPSIIFFDELDSLVPSRGVAGDSNGVMDRMVSQLLSELDELQTRKSCAVFVMGATNRPDLLDKCLLSPGRFDKLIEVKTAFDLDSKIRILTPICKKVNLANELSVEEIARQCPNEMSGAELTALISNAAMHAIRSVILNADKQSIRDVRIEREHIQHALHAISTQKATID